jgi:SAM-dependent methyltransferase
MFLKNTFIPNHDSNRMRDEGNVEKARNLFYTSKSTSNLNFLLKNRFIWMNQFIKQEDFGLEVGSGTGISKDFIISKNYFISDFSNYNYLDFKLIDALNTGFENEKFDFVVSSNMIHHVPYPFLFFQEMNRILKPEGKLIIQEINGSFFMRGLLKLMRHEGYNYNVNVFDKEQICTNPNDLWSANCVIPNLLFDNIEKFESEFNEFKVIYRSHSEFLNFINSGGVIAKTFHLPLPIFCLRIIKKIDDFLSKISPNLFALQRQIVLEKI